MQSKIIIAAAALMLAPAPASAASLYLGENKPTAYDFVDIPSLPAEFGRGEFAMELWIKPDASYPVGSTWRASYDQLRNWSDADSEPYSSDGWWLAGNWLIDGHTRPEGFLAGNSREGTLSLQFYGGGRLRFMFADGKQDMPKGMVHAVQAWPATSSPSLLDGKWHHVVVVRRWREPTGATLELWIDGARTAATDIPHRTDMRQYWDKLAHPGDPEQLGGWSIGSEVMTAWNYALTQYEDYKGLVDDLRFWGMAPSPAEIGRWAKGERMAKEKPLAHFAFDEASGETVSDKLDPAYQLTIHRGGPQTWSIHSAPGKK